MSDWLKKEDHTVPVCRNSTLDMHGEKYTMQTWTKRKLGAILGSDDVD